MTDMDVRIVPRNVYEPWLTKRHYARRVPIVQYAFGVFIDRECAGVVTYGPPASPQVAKSAIHPDYRHLIIELNRLCVDDDAPKNTSSALVGRSLSMLPRPLVVVSYADGSQGHVGYIYQATNFDYYGLSPESGASEFMLPDGTSIHRRTIVAQGRTDPSTWAKENGYLPKPHKRKHRYIYIVGSSRQRKAIRPNILWTTEPYPKEASSRYDASAPLDSQVALF